MEEIVIGTKIGSLIILDKVKTKKGVFFEALCSCGNKKMVSKSNLTKWNYKKCSCFRKNKGGLSYSPLYSVWKSMIRRCYEPNAHGYKYYGGKGIKVCEQWKNEIDGYINFYNWSMENGYKEEKLISGKNKYTIDRVDNNKDYCPKNCRWVEYETQLTNLPKLCTNKSGYIGISWSKQERKWLSVISIGNKTKRIGGYKTQKEAVEARNKYIDDNNLQHKKNTYIGELSNGY